MDVKKKISKTETTASPDAKKRPVKVFRIEDVSVAIFANARFVQGQERIFHSCNFQRSYKDASGTWKRTQWFDLDDLGHVMQLSQQASDFIREQLQQQEAA